MDWKHTMEPAASPALSQFLVDVDHSTPRNEVEMVEWLSRYRGLLQNVRKDLRDEHQSSLLEAARLLGPIQRDGGEVKVKLEAEERAWDAAVQEQETVRLKVKEQNEQESCLLAQRVEAKEREVAQQRKLLQESQQAFKDEDAEIEERTRKFQEKFDMAQTVCGKYNSGLMIKVRLEDGIIMVELLVDPNNSGPPFRKLSMRMRELGHDHFEVINPPAWLIPLAAELSKTRNVGKFLCDARNLFMGQIRAREK